MLGRLLQENDKKKSKLDKLARLVTCYNDCKYTVRWELTKVSQPKRSLPQP